MTRIEEQKPKEIMHSLPTPDLPTSDKQRLSVPLPSKALYAPSGEPTLLGNIAEPQDASSSNFTFSNGTRLSEILPLASNLAAQHDGNNRRSLAKVAVRPEIEVLFLYTSRALDGLYQRLINAGACEPGMPVVPGIPCLNGAPHPNKVGNMLNRFNAIRDLTNQAFANSRIPASMRIAGAYEVTFDESTQNSCNDIISILAGFKSGVDVNFIRTKEGVGVATLRNQVSFLHHAFVMHIAGVDRIFTAPSSNTHFLADLMPKADASLVHKIEHKPLLLFLSRSS